MKLLRIVPDDTKFGFMRFRRISFPFSAILSILSVVAFFWLGMNVGIDFTGGTLLEMQAKDNKADVTFLRQTAAQLNIGEVEIQELGNKGEVLFRVGLQPGGEKAQQAIVEKVKAKFADKYEFRRVEVVGPRVSEELIQNGTLGVLFSLLATLIYLWFRFEWQFAVGALIATMHDLVLTIGFFAITQLEFNMTSIASILTIVGYSLNDTVVVYDRIREMLRKFKRMGTDEMLDHSINTTLSRTVITSFTTVLSLLALGIFGGEVIRGFALSMLFGVVIGTYSSIFIAAPVLIYLGLKVGEAPARVEGNKGPAAPSV